MLATDSSFIFFGTGAREIEPSRQAFLTKHEAEDWAQLDSIAFETPEYTHIQASPELAVVMYQTTLHFVLGGEQGSSPLRFALTLAREGGRWRIRQGLAALTAQ